MQLNADHIIQQLIDHATTCYCPYEIHPPRTTAFNNQVLLGEVYISLVGFEGGYILIVGAGTVVEWETVCETTLTACLMDC